MGMIAAGFQSGAVKYDCDVCTAGGGDVISEVVRIILISAVLLEAVLSLTLIMIVRFIEPIMNYKYTAHTMEWYVHVVLGQNVIFVVPAAPVTALMRMAGRGCC